MKELFKGMIEALKDRKINSIVIEGESSFVPFVFEDNEIRMFTKGKIKPVDEEKALLMLEFAHSVKRSITIK